jgi:hypothetical protein
MDKFNHLVLLPQETESTPGFAAFRHQASLYPGFLVLPRNVSENQAIFGVFDLFDASSLNLPRCLHIGKPGEKIRHQTYPD